MLKNYIQRRLISLTKKYLKKHAPQLVVITGTVGKTSTKVAIATVLSEKYRVRADDTDAGSPGHVPLGILGIEYPQDPESYGSWFETLQAAKLRIKQAKDVDIIIQELWSEQPGDIIQFGKYLTPDIAVVTAVSADHVTMFKNLDTIAQDELSVAKFSKLTIINRDDIDIKFASYTDTHNIDTYGISEAAEYRIDTGVVGPLEGKMGRFIGPDQTNLSVNLQLIGAQNIKAAVAAGVVGLRMGLSSQQVAVGISKIQPLSGRMQILRGLDESVLIDDTYSSSPLSAVAALDTLYATEATQRIAILGSMTDLGMMTAEAHEQVGLHCDPSKLNWVVTIGKEAAEHIAQVAHSKGCQVKSFESPYQAGGFVHGILKPGSVVLAKGSGEGIYTEEALKVLLHSTEDEQKLVRQSDEWLDKKRSQFSS